MPFKNAIRITQKSPRGPFSSVVCEITTIIIIRIIIIRIIIHGNGQFGESFGRCVRCDFVVRAVLHAFGDSPSPLKIDASHKKTEKK